MVRRPLVWLLLVVLLLAGGPVAAVGYEVLALRASLVGVVKGGGAPGGLPGRLGGRERPAITAPSGPLSAAPSDATIAFTVTEDDLARLLRRRDRWLGGLLALDRDTACRLSTGHIGIESRNRLLVAGLTVARYAASTDWSLAAAAGGVGVHLNDLRLAGVAVPGPSALLAGFGRRADGWLVVPTGARHTVLRIEIGGGRLSVTGRLGSRA